MRVELENNQLDLGSTPIENMFINTYLSQANEIQIKVYIYALSQAHSKNENISNENIAREMGLTEGQVVDAWRYWMDQGLVERREETFVFKSVVYQYISAISQTDYETNDNVSISSNNPEWLDYSADAVSSRDLINNIEEFISQGSAVKTTLNTREIRIIMELMNEFHVSQDFLSYAYMMASNVRGLKAVDPVIATVRNWLIDGATSFEKLEEYLSRQEKRNEEKKNISNNTKSDNLHAKDDRMTKEERNKFIESKLKKKLPINRRNQ